MTIGSFDLGGKQIDVEPDYSQIDGRIYRLFLADSRQQVAVTTYRGFEVADGVPFGKDDLHAGLRGVLRRSTRS